MLDHFLIPYTKIKIKINQKPNCKTGHYKTLRGIHGQNNL